MKYLIITMLLIVSLNIEVQAKAHDLIALECRWTLNTHIIETFVIDLSKKSAYWVNENKSLEFVEINSGRLVITGVKGKVKGKKNVKLTFTINRINGDLYISGIVIPSGYNNLCIKKERLF